MQLRRRAPFRGGRSRGSSWKNINGPPIFKATVRLIPSQVIDVRNRGRIRGGSLRSTAHVRRFR